MLNGLDLFSGIGGLSLALNEWVRPISYCENDPYCQAVLLSRMQTGRIPVAPIWDDVRSFSSCYLPTGYLDIAYGGFPCQDISVAGLGKGLEGERSGLFFEILRISKEVKPVFIFLENVPAITSRGGIRVISEITAMGYDCRWCVISAASCGAPHKRDRWFCLARNSMLPRVNDGKEQEIYDSEQKADTAGICESLPNTDNDGCSSSQINRSSTEGLRNPQEGADSTLQSQGMDSSRDVANTSGAGLEGQRIGTFGTESKQPLSACYGSEVANSPRTQLYNAWEGNAGERRSPIGSSDESWWAVEPAVGRVAHGIPNRVDRIRVLGNAVVPQQAKKAFKILMGIV